VKLNVREGLKAASVTKLSLKVAQNEQKRSKSRKQNCRYLAAGKGI
jgi:hypothetical protein